MWRAFYRTCTGKAALGLPERVKPKRLHRVVGPTLDYHNSRWAVMPNFMAEIDRVQRNVTAIVLRLRKGPEESPEGFVRRRASAAGQVASANGLRSLRTASRIVAWQAHVARAANVHKHSSLSMQSGRTGTRLHQGKPQTRWHDGAVYAREYLQRAEQLPAPASAARSRAEFDRIVQQQRHKSDILDARLSCSGNCAPHV